MKTFDFVRETDSRPDDLLPELVRDLSYALGSANYGLQNVLESQSASILTYTRSYRRWPTWVFGLILFPLLFVTSTATITVMLEPTEGGGTRIQVTGEGERSVLRAFEKAEF